MAKDSLTLTDELSGFYPGNQGSAVTFTPDGNTLRVSTKYAVDFEDDSDGWDWGLGITDLNVRDIADLRDYLNEFLKENNSNG